MAAPRGSTGPQSAPRMRVSAVVLGAPDPRALAAFYKRLLGWRVVDDSPVWVRIRPPSGGAGLSFQHEPSFVPPVWPAAPGEQRMTSHLDIAVEDLEAAVDWASDAGAALADHQPQDDVRVMLDPVGHPFCLFRGSPRGEFGLVDWSGFGSPPSSGEARPSSP